MRNKLFRRNHTRGGNYSDLLSDESGQTIIVAALCMAMLIGFLGLAIDVGHLRYVKRNLQTAADAAALAAAMEIRVCGGTYCKYMESAANQALSENGLTVTNSIAGCKAVIPATGLTLQVNNGPCGVSDPNNGKTTYVEAIVSQPQKMWFASVLGINNVPVSARAEAMRNPAAPCMYALDPSGDGAITVLAAVGLQFNCGIVDESSSPSALKCLLGIGISAPQIAVHGGPGGEFLCESTPPPQFMMPLPVPADPLAYLQPPTEPPLNKGSNCGSGSGNNYTGSASQININVLSGLLQTYKFNPGVYCGGISITVSALTNITFAPGIYILKDAPAPGLPGLLGVKTGGFSITVTALSSIVGNGVMFYNEGPTGSLNVSLGSILGLSTFNLTAPTTGNYAGILFFQPSNVTVSGSFGATLLSSQSMNGAIYAPGALISYGVNALSSPSSYNIVVAKDIDLVAGVLTSFGNDYSSLPAGSPLNGDDAVLVQ